MRVDLSRTVIIFNHIPKTGGTSLIAFFQSLLGKERCFRHSTRDGKTDTYSPPIESLPASRLAELGFVAGHFEYGHHKRFVAPVKYISVMRDPIERLVSDYNFNRKSGRKDLKALTNSMTLEEYVDYKIAQPKSTLTSSGQVQFMTRQQTAKEAKSVIRNRYLACCAVEQLDDMQRLLARLYDRPDLEPEKRNRSEKPAEKSVLSDGYQAILRERCKEDYLLLDWVTKRFENHYRNLTHPIPDVQP